MSGPFRGCIADAVTAGDLDPETARIAEEAYDDAFEAASGAFGPVDADRMAAEAVMKKLEAEKIEARRRRQLMVRTRRQALEAIGGMKTARGYQGVRTLGGGDGSGRPPKGGWVQGGAPPPPGQPNSKGAIAAMAIKRLVENRPGMAAAPGASLAGRYRTIRGGFDARMAEVIEAFETKTGLDRPGRATLDNIGREAFGEDSGDAVSKALNAAWQETAEAARLAYNAAGGSIGKIDNWGFPTLHDSDLVRRAGKQAWIDAELPRLDRAGMIDRMTGQPFTEARLRGVLGETWDNIASRGAAKTAPGEHPGRGTLAKKRSGPRFLKYKSYADWKASQDQFGRADLYEVMMSHLDGMAVDIAQMQVLGPNPRHQFQWLMNFARREAAIEEAGGAVGAIDRAEGLLREAERMYDHFTGDANVPVNTTLAQVGATTRAFLTGAMLGSAILGEVGTAPVLGAYTRSFVGLSRAGDMGQLMRLLSDPAERAIARRTGFILEGAMDGFVRGSHDNLRLMTVGARAEGGMNALARRLPTAVMRAQGLSGFVAARKHAFRMDFMGLLVDKRGMRMADLMAGDEQEQALGRWLAARGFTEQDWAVIRATEPWEPRAGAKMLVPRDVADAELGARLGEAIDLETRFLTPETTLETRAWWTTERPGTFLGELQRSTGMFKGFAATLTVLYGQEIALRAARGGGSVLLKAAGMAAPAVIFLTIGGAVNIQLRDMAKGNDPRPMDDPKFWGAALMQGGGLGIAGDFLYSAQARNGKSAEIVGSGPVGQLASDTWNLTGGNLVEIAGALGEGEDLGEAVAGARIGRDAARFVVDYNPLASLWWSRAAFDRMIGDNLQKALDPEAEEDFARQRRRMERERGQSQWWPEGQTLPERAPDLTAMAGG